MDEEYVYCDPGQPESPYNVSIQFRMQVTAGVGSTDILLDEMDGFTIFLFDGDGKFLRMEEVERDYLLAHNNVVTLEVAPGPYQMVCWGNANEYSMITNLTPGVDIYDAAIVHTYTQGGKVVVVPDGDPLYYAPRTSTRMVTLNSQLSTLNSRAARSAGGAYAFTVPEQGTVHADIDFLMAHKKIRVYVEEFAGHDAGGSPTDCPDIRIGALTCGYDFLMQRVEGAAVTYHNRAVQQVDTRSSMLCAMAGFNTPLFDYDDQLSIDVLNPADGEVRHTLDLIGELKKRNINPADEDIREIRVDITFADTFSAAIKITIPGWNGKPTLPGLN